MSRWPAPCLMLITDRFRLRGRTLEEVASQAVEGGAHAVQLREKELPTAELRTLAATLHAALRDRAMLLVNGRIDIALAVGADGVHLPERSLRGSRARDIAGDACCIVGRSVHSAEAAVAAEAEGADYLQVGTIFETSSKPGRPAAGLSLLREVREAASIPIIAVGGINARNAAGVIAAGADGVAVIGAIMDADDPRQAARDLRREIDAAYGSCR